jgi:hypothetical protein
MSIVEFITLRLDEKEMTAKAISLDEPFGGRVYRDDDGCISAPIGQWDDGNDRLPNHRNAWRLIYDPAQVLREVVALRAMVDTHKECGTGHGYCDGDPHRRNPPDRCYEQVLMASMWSDHEDCDPSWKVD